MNSISLDQGIGKLVAGLEPGPDGEVGVVRPGLLVHHSGEPAVGSLVSWKSADGTGVIEAPVHELGHLSDLGLSDASDLWQSSDLAL